MLYLFTVRDRVWPWEPVVALYTVQDHVWLREPVVASVLGPEPCFGPGSQL